MIHYELINRLFENRTIKIEQVTGGSVNAVYSVKLTDGSKSLIKINEIASLPQMLEKEAFGIEYLNGKSSISVPKIVDFGVKDGLQYLRMEFIEDGIVSSDFWKNFGQGLSKLHDCTNACFGFDHDNYIGSLRQSNCKHDNWDSFLANERFIPMVKLAMDSKVISREEGKMIESIYVRINELWPEEPPALLHGDLWSGNFMVGEDDRSVLIDPAVYYGHREMDIGMMHLFGGFDEVLFESYNEMYKLEDGWRERIRYNQIYPLLVHLNLFGRVYLSQLLNITRKF